MDVQRTLLPVLPRAGLAQQDALFLAVAVALVSSCILHIHSHPYNQSAPGSRLSTCASSASISSSIWSSNALNPYTLDSTLASVIAFSTHLTTILGATLLYRASPWHPLARYPGPFVYRLSKLVLAWTTSDGKQHVHLKQLHERYGDIVRIGPNEVSLRTPLAIVPVLGPNGLPKGPHWAGRNMAEHGKQLVSLTDGREHAWRRRPWNRAFSVPALKGYEEIITRRAEQLIELFARHTSDADPADVGKTMSAFTYDTMSDMVFGGGSEQMRVGDEDSVWHMIEEGLAASQVMAQCPWVGIYMGYVPWAARYMKQLLDYGDQRVMARLRNGSHSRDLFYYLSNEDGVDKVSPSFEQIASDGAMAIVAGSDTTSCTLANVLYCVLSHPEVYKRLQAEIDAYFPPGENAMDTTKHPDMPYLNAVINETLRLYPPVPDGSQRATTRKSGGRMVGDHYIPPGTTVNLSFYTLQRDPRNFYPQPDGFWPERWLIAAGQEAYPPASKEAFVHNLDAFIPFSYGPANCVGKALGVQKMRMVLCLMLQKLRLRFSRGWDAAMYDGEISDWYVMTKPHQPVVVEVRSGVIIS